MQKITRTQAEEMINPAEIVNSDVSQNAHNLNITLTLIDNRSFIIRWDLLLHKKSYFMQLPAI